jgi:XapX domain-containing protein
VQARYSPLTMDMAIMKAYFVSLVVGVAVGLLYNVLHVRSPAPPTVALVGLLGMLGGEHLIPLVRSLFGFTVN